MGQDEGRDDEEQEVVWYQVDSEDKSAAAAAVEVKAVTSLEYRV